MNHYLTEIRAIDPADEELKTWSGPVIEAISFADAEEQAPGYCKVIGLLISEIPVKADGLTPDWDNATEYDNQN